MSYCFDTSAFLCMGRRTYPDYPRDVFPQLWENVEVIIESGRLFICQEAFEEMLGPSGENQDEMVMWLKQMKDRHGSFFNATDEAIQMRAKEISADYPKLIDKNREKDADPFVIAHAQERGAVVVTQERALQQPRRQEIRKIPNVCQRLGIKCINLVDFMRRESMQF